MSKFEQLLDLLINEEHDKAQELFHEIVVEKSREIYENLIAEEEDDEEMDEAREEDEQDESVDEGTEDDEEMDEGAEEEADESMDLEDSYMMDSDGEDGDKIGGDATDDFGHDIGAMDDEPGEEGGEEDAIMDIKSAIAELEAAFAELEQAKGMGGDEAGDAEFGADDEEDGEMDMMGQPAFESRKLREYSEKVGNDWDKNSQKTDGDDAGAGTGEKMSKPVAGKSPVSAGKGKPTTGATAHNILGDSATGKGKNTGDRPDSLNKGIAQVSGEKIGRAHV